MNLGIPIAITITLFHLITTKIVKTESLMISYVIFTILTILIFVIMFFIDYLYFNSHKTLKDIFDVDYKGWIYGFGSTYILITPVIYKLVQNKAST